MGINIPAMKWLALAALLLAAPALAQQPPAWFAPSFLDIREDLAEAAKEGRRLMVYFHQDGCPYCKRLVEVNFRDEKSLLGVSEAQLRQPEAVRRQPAGAVAAYAFMLLAAHDAYGHDGRPPSVPLPRWRRRQPPLRPTTGQLISQLRVELWSQCLRRDTLSHFRSRSVPDQKCDKLGAHLASAVFYAHN